MQGNFLVFAHASPRACPRRASLVVRIQFKIHSNFVQYTPPKLKIGIGSRNGVGAHDLWVRRLILFATVKNFKNKKAGVFGALCSSNTPAFCSSR